MPNTLTFAGTALSQFGVYISGSGVFNAPERDVTVYTIPGRNGDLVIDNGRFKNISVTYPCGIVGNFAENMANLRAFLLSHAGYQTLSDTYNSGEFRQAIFSGPIDVTPSILNRAGEFNLTFNCKPQRFLTSGNTPLVYASTSSGNIAASPTPFPAKPLIVVSGGGAGTLTIAGQSFQFTAIPGTATIDCETQNIYNGAKNLNNTVSVSGWPVLTDEPTPYSFANGITKISVTPRWWTV